MRSSISGFNILGLGLEVSFLPTPFGFMCLEAAPENARGAGASVFPGILHYDSARLSLDSGEGNAEIVQDIVLAVVDGHGRKGCLIDRHDKGSESVSDFHS
jgi:hypothetical protein